MVAENSVKKAKNIMRSIPTMFPNSINIINITMARIHTFKKISSQMKNIPLFVYYCIHTVKNS
jgi:hypothetical protein